MGLYPELLRRLSEDFKFFRVSLCNIEGIDAKVKLKDLWHSSVIWFLPRMHESLHSTPNTAKMGVSFSNLWGFFTEAGLREGC